MIIVITIAICIIAACEVVRVIQNERQIRMYRHDQGSRDNAYAEFVKSLKRSDREFVERVLKEFEEVRNE